MKIIQQRMTLQHMVKDDQGVFQPVISYVGIASFTIDSGHAGGLRLVRAIGRDSSVHYFRLQNEDALEVYLAFQDDTPEEGELSFNPTGEEW